MTENPPEVEDNEAQELAALLAGLVRAEDAAFAMTDQPDSRKVERVARAMAESVELAWEALPEKPDIACRHGMPEGCREYWYDLATAAIATTALAPVDLPRLDLAKD